MGTVNQTGWNKPVDGSQTGAVSVTLGSATVSGRSLLVCVAGYTSGANFGTGDVTDNKGNTFTLDFEVPTGANEIAVAFYSCSNIVGGTSHQVTVTNSALMGKHIGVVEYSALVTFDKSASTVDDTASPTSSGTTPTLTAQPGIALAGMAIDSGSNSTITQDGDYTLIGEAENGSVDMAGSMVYKLLSATTAEDCSWTWGHTASGNGAQAGIVTYYDQGAGQSFNLPVGVLTLAGVQPALTRAPGVPTNLDGSPGDGQVALTWDAPTDNGGSAITDYVVQYRLHV